jgi:hypothetical protein
MPKIKAPVAALALFLSSIGVSHAGPYGDDLTKCLVESTTIADKGTLVNWVFSMASLHPEVKGASSLTTEQRTAISKRTADLFTDLITERCKKAAIAAVKYEGPKTFETSFGALGQAAMFELFSNPDVAKGLAELGSYFDEAKFKAAFEEAKGE